MSCPKLPPRGLYLVTREMADTAALLAIVRAAIAGGAAIVQYRDKRFDHAARLAQATALRELCHAAGVPLIVNDDVALAAASGAAGVHLGADDASIAAARAALGADAIVGVSCYDDPVRARVAAAEGADYVAFGAWFASPTKPGARNAGPAQLAAIADLGLPRVAIGGITRDNARIPVAAGAQFVAVISDVFDADDPRAAAAAIAAHFQEPIP